MPIRDDLMAGGRCFLISALLVCACGAIANSAWAEPSQTDRVLARSLFEQGKSLMTAGNFKQACPKLAESQRLDPAGGTLLNLAACHEKDGKTASAWSEFNDALALAKKDGRKERIAAAQERISAIEPVLSRLTIRLATGTDAPGLTVKLDGVLIGSAVFGTAVPVDPGSHQVEASATGRKPWTGNVEIGPRADNKSIEIPALQDAPASPPTASTQPGSSPLAPPAVQGPSRGRRTAGFVIGGVGLTAVGVGSFFGLAAAAKWKDAKAHCPKDVCDQEAPMLRKDAIRSAWASNVGIGVGVLGLGIGAYLLLSSGSKPAPPQAAATHEPLRVLPAVGPGGGAVMVTGSW